RLHEVVSSFDLKFFIEDEYLGTRVLEATVDEAGTVYVFTPWLREGTHRLKILWVGARSWRNFRADAVRLRTIGGPDSSGRGISNWVEDRIFRQSGSDPHVPAYTY